MTTGSAGPVPARPVQVTRHQVVRRLTRAAAHSDAQLIAEAAALAEGWAVLADPMGGVVCSTPDTAGPEGVRAAAHPQLYPHLTIRSMAGAVLVVRPGTASPASRIDLIARTCVDLLRMRARVRREEDTHRTEQRLHTAVLHLLLSGQSHLATEVLRTSATHATVFRLAGQLVHAAYQSHWREVQPSVSPQAHRMLVCLEGGELVVVALHGLDHDRHVARPLVARRIPTSTGRRRLRPVAARHGRHGVGRGRIRAARRQVRLPGVRDLPGVARAAPRRAR
jgi:hypothetical protein